MSIVSQGKPNVSLEQSLAIALERGYATTGDYSKRY